MRLLIVLIAFTGVASALPPWETVGPGGFGCGLMSITQSFDDPDVLYSVGGPVSQGNYILHSMNRGEQWGLLSSPASPQNHPAVMALTPDGVMLFAQSNQDQIARSSDDGLTWTWVGIGSDYSTVYDIATLPGVPGCAWAVGRGKTGGGPYRAFFWRTTDSGLSWSTDDLLTTGSEAFRISACAIDPNVIYVSGRQNTSPRVPMIMRSSDGGSSWTDVTPPECIATDSIGLGVAVSPVDPLLVLFSTRRNVYRSSDGGQSWSVVSGEDWVHDIEFSQADPEAAFAGGNGAILSSANAGLSWSRVEVWTGSDSVTAVFPSRTDQNSVFAGGTGGFLESSNAGAVWTTGNEGMMLTATGSITASSGPSPRLYMVVDGTVALSDDLGSSWSARTTPEGMNTYGLNIVVDPFDIDHIVCLDYTGGIYSSDDGGSTWTASDSELDFGGAAASVPSTPGLMYAAGSRNVSGESFMSLGTSYDGGLTWSFQDLGDSPGQIYALTVDQQHPDTVYAGGSYTTMQGNVLLRSTDGCSSWEEVQTPVNFYGIYDVAVNPDDPGIILLGGYDGLFRSPDFGASWILVEPCSYVERVLFDPSIPGRAWFYQCGTELLGISVSSDAGLTWSQWNEGLVTYLDVDALALVPGQRLYASTACSAFALDLSVTGISEETGSDPAIYGILSITPNPMRTSGNICYSVADAGPVEFLVFDMAGRVVSRFTDQPENEGMNSVIWTPGSEGQLNSGVYFIRMRSGQEGFTTRVILLE